MDLEWQDRRLLNLLADEGPLGASAEDGPNGASFRFDCPRIAQDGSQVGDDPIYEAPRVRRLEADGLLSMTPGAAGQLRVEITSAGRAACKRA